MLLALKRQFSKDRPWIFEGLGNRDRP